MNMTDIAYGDVAYAYNVTLRSEKRSNAAQEIVDKGIQLLNDSMKVRGQMEDLVNTKDPYGMTHSSMYNRSKDMLDNLAVLLAELEQKRQQNNRFFCGDESSCGACTAKNCSMCGGANCTGVKDLAKMALMRAQKAEEAIRKKESKAFVFF